MDVGIDQLQLSELRIGRTLPAVAASLIKQILDVGQVQPVVVRSLGKRRFEILANAETWLAVMRAGMRTVRIDVIDATDAEARAMVNSTLDVDPIQEARQFANMLDRPDRPRKEGDIAELAREIGISRSYLAHSLRLLLLAPDVRRAVATGALSRGHAKVILRLSSHEDQAALALQIIAEGWSVRRAERDLSGRTGQGAGRTETTTPDPWIQQLEKHLSETVGSSVTIDQRRGHVTIDYCSDNDVLDGILERLGYHSSD